MKNFLVFVLLAAFTLVPLASAKESASSELEKVRLQFKWSHQFQFAGYYAAVEKGFYRHAGLKVELIEGKAGVGYVQEVISGKAEYGTGVPSLVIDRNNGEPIVVLATIFQHSPHVLLLKADSEIETPHDLSGKRLMIRVDGTASVVAMLVSEGIPLENIEIKKHSWDIDDLIDGKTDAFAAYITDAPFLLKEKGIPAKVIKPITYGIDFYGDCLFTSEGHIRKNPMQVKAFRQASLKGWEYAMGNIEEIIELIHEKYAPNKTIEALRNEAREMEKLILPRLVEMGHMNPGRWEHIAGTYVKLGMLEPDYSLEGFIYDPDQKLDYHLLLIVAGVAAGLLISGVLGVAMTRHLRRLVAKRTSQLDKSQKRYRAIVQDQTELICRNLPDCTLTFVNDAYCRFFGKKQEELIGESFLQFIPEDQKDTIEKGFKTLTPDNPVKEWQHQVILPCGETAWMVWTNRAIFDDNGDVIEFQGAGRDITERKKVQAESEMLMKSLEAKNSELQSVVYTVSHDLKSPLVNIKGFSGVLTETEEKLRYLLNTDMPHEEFRASVKKLFNEDVHESVEFIVSSTDKMNVLLNGLLAVSRVGSSNIHIQKLNTADLVQEVLKSMQFQVDDNHAEIEIGTLPDCMGDVAQVSSIFMNLIDNSLKYRSPDRDCLLRVSGQVVNDKSVYCVEDNGIGISENHLCKIFDLFHRLNPNDGIEGQGVGLTIINRILQRQKGNIRVESEYGKGTKFYVELPTG